MKYTDYISKGRGTNASGEVKIGWNKNQLFEADIYAIIDNESVLLDVRGRYLLKERNVWITLHDGLVVNTETPVVAKKVNKLSVDDSAEAKAKRDGAYFFKGSQLSKNQLTKTSKGG